MCTERTDTTHHLTIWKWSLLNVCCTFLQVFFAMCIFVYLFKSGIMWHTWVHCLLCKDEACYDDPPR